MQRIIWRRYYRNLRLWWRGQAAQLDYEIIHGTGDPTKVPVGILDAAGLR